MLKKLSYFWSYWEVSNNQDIRFITSRYTPIVRFLPLTFGIVAPLGVLGIVLTLRRAKAMFPLWGFVLIYMTSVVLFFVTARFRVPVVAVLLLLAGHAVCWLFGALRRQQWKPLGLAALVLVAMGFVASRRPPKVDVLMLQEHKETGISLLHAERFVESEQLLSDLVKQSKAVHRKIDAETWYWLGYGRVKLQKYGDAVECFENALAKKPDYPAARGMLGVALASLGRLDDAIEQFERQVSDDPENAAAHANLSSALARARRIDEAVKHAVNAIKLDQSSGDRIVETATLLQQQARSADALALLRACAEQAPDNLPITISLIQMLALQSSVAAQVEAVELAEKACKQTKRQNPEVLHAAARAWFVDGQLKKAVAAEREAVNLAAQHNQPDLLKRCEQSLQQYEAAIRRRP
jgi:tetratricopeptide (TPR) repeat protein